MGITGRFTPLQLASHHMLNLARSHVTSLSSIQQPLAAEQHIKRGFFGES